MLQNIQIPSAKAVISAAASVAATAMLIRSFAIDFIPRELRGYIISKLHHLFSTTSQEIIIVIDEFDGLSKNQLFQAADIYLGSILRPSTKRFRAALPHKEKKIKISMERNEELTDTFCGFQLKWRMVCKQIQARHVSHHGDYDATMISYFELRFHKQHRKKVVDEYLPYVLERSKAAQLEKKTLKLFTLRDLRMMMVHRRGNPWHSVNLDHPATFATLAMDTDIKEMVVDDLDKFVTRKDLYRKVGKAWKRGYLLFGPPGTGKSSLIAAMANYLKFDIYDLELTDIRSNSELRQLLISTGNQSILVVEDIDCSIELTEKRPKSSRPSVHPHTYSQGDRVTLSGLLNFIDGLWSSCGDERIIVFTTNHKEKLDPALLRPGRMDIHIHMSYCTPSGFKLLAFNYLGISEHPLFVEIEEEMKAAKVTPAEVGEQLLKDSEPEIALRCLIGFLEEKKKNVEVEADGRNDEISKKGGLLTQSDEKGGSKEDKIIDMDTTKQLVKELLSEVGNQQQKRKEIDDVLRGLIHLLQNKKETEEESSGSG